MTKTPFNICKRRFIVCFCAGIGLYGVRGDEMRNAESSSCVSRGFVVRVTVARRRNGVKGVRSVQDQRVGEGDRLAVEKSRNAHRRALRESNAGYVGGK